MRPWEPVIDPENAGTEKEAVRDPETNPTILPENPPLDSEMGAASIDPLKYEAENDALPTIIPLEFITLPENDPEKRPVKFVTQ
jgi:hypothetical protein